MKNVFLPSIHWLTVGSICVWTILREKRARFHSKNSGKIHDLLFSCGEAASFNVGNDIASHATPMQLHFGDESFLRPIFAVPKLDDVSSNEVSVAERAH
jgi:hypothetical protein